MTAIRGSYHEGDLLKSKKSVRKIMMYLFIDLFANYVTRKPSNEIEMIKHYRRDQR